MKRVHFNFLLSAHFLLGLTIAAGHVQAQSGIAAANIQVLQHDTNNTPASVTVTATLAINDLRIRAGSNRGDYNVQVGADGSDDVVSGVLLACVAENGRDNGELALPGTNFCTSAVDYSRTGDTAGSYFVSTFQAPTGNEYNINAAAAFFCYSNWWGGLARNSGATNGGADDLFTGSPGLVPGTNFVDYGGGRYSVNLTNLGIDSRTDGILLVGGGQNRNHYALSQVSTDGTWNVFVKSNGSDGAAYVPGPLAFVYVPRTNATVVSGRFHADGSPLLFSGASPLFSITNTGLGTWRLTIPGQTPASGVLLLSAEGGASQNEDNIVSYQPDNDGWIIQSRDLPGNPPSLETPGPQPVASFVFIPSLAPTLAGPTNTSEVGASPTLQVALFPSLSGARTVTFYGRLAGVHNTNRDFTIVAIPDSQYYSASMNGGLPAMFTAQTDWTVAQRATLNMAFVTHLGDITDHGQDSGNDTEWLAATNALYRLENPLTTHLPIGIPYGLCPGNHDQTPNGAGEAGDTTFFNQFFGTNHFARRGYYGGHYGTNNNNSYQLFTAGGQDFIFLHFQYDTNVNTPSAPVLVWANNVLKTNASRRALVTSHWIVNTGNGASFSPQGQAIYTALRTNANLFLMLCGHISGEGQRTDVFNGQSVYSILTDYQSLTNGGNGWLRYYTFSPSNDVIHAFTYSPWLGQYQTDADSQFDLPYPMELAVTNPVFTALATNVLSASNSLAACVWPGLASGNVYEWYAVASDGAGNVAASSVGRFQTQNYAPVAVSQNWSLAGDQATNLILTGTDANRDALTYQTNSFPTHGLLQNFDPGSGAVTYIPAHGFHGSDQFTFSVNDGQLSSPSATISLSVLAPANVSGDGLPDAWKNMYGIADPYGDADGDGQSNLAEYLAGTNPTNAASKLQFTAVALDNLGHTVLVWQSVGGTRYRVQYCDEAVGGGTGFLDIVRPVTDEMDAAPVGAESTLSFIDDGTRTGGQPKPGYRFYRLKVVQ